MNKEIYTHLGAFLQIMHTNITKKGKFPFPDPQFREEKYHWKQSVKYAETARQRIKLNN